MKLSDALQVRDLAVGQLRRQSRLGNEAIYRVAGLVGPLVEVEVISAPGLASGRRVRFTRASVLSMVAGPTVARAA